jgi:hypothetical protein
MNLDISSSILKIIMPNSLLEISKYHSGKIFHLKYAMAMMPDLSKMG